MSEFTQIRGVAELKANLARIPRDVTKKLLRKGVGIAAGDAKRDVRQAAAPSRKTGTLDRAALVKYDRTQSNDTQAVYLVTFRRGKKWQQGAKVGKGLRKSNVDAFYASWLEFGHRTRGKRRGGASGNVAGKRYLTTSFEQGRYRSIATIERVVREGFEAAVK